MIVNSTTEMAIEQKWASMPLYMSCGEIITLGFPRSIVYKWFKRPDFPPMIRLNGKRVNKYKLREWLEEMEERFDEI